MNTSIDRNWFDVFYHWIREVFTPAATWLSRVTIRIGGKDRIVFTANNVTIFRTLMVFPICWLILNGNTITAALLFVFACITDFVDGMLAKIQGSTTFGEFLDGFCDKLFWIPCLFVTVTSGDYWFFPPFQKWAVLLISILLIAIEASIGGFRLINYLERRKYGDSGPDLKATTSGGKPKFVLETIGLAGLLLAHPAIFESWMGWVGIVALWLALPFASISLHQKIFPR